MKFVLGDYIKICEPLLGGSFSGRISLVGEKSKFLASKGDSPTSSQ